MFRRQAYALAAAAAALTVCSLALSGLDADAWREGRSRRLTPFPWSEARKAVIHRPEAGTDGTTTLFKDGGGAWRLELPEGLSDEISPDAEAALAAFAALAWREVLPGRAPPDPSSAPALAVTGAGGETVSIAFGEVRDGLLSAVVDGDAASVYGVNQDLAAFLQWPKERFRSLLLAAGEGEPQSIRLSPADPGRRLDIALERGDAGWVMTEPVSWPVDENRLDLLLRWIQRLRAEGIAAEMTGDPEYFGFDGDSPFVEIRCAAPDGSERTRRIEFGGGADARAGGGGTIYARETSRSPVFTLPRDAMAEISLDIAARHPEAWRNFFRRRSLDRVGSEIPARIVIERLLPRPAKLTITRSPGPERPGWFGTLEEGGRSRAFAVDPPDGRNRMLPLAALFTGLASLRVKNFLAETPPGPETAALTAHPAWRFSMRTADGRQLPGLTLYALDAEGNLPAGPPFAEGSAEPLAPAPRPGVAPGAGIAFSVPDRDAVMETFSELSPLLCLPLYRYQSRNVIHADPGTWTKFDVLLAPESAGTEGKTFSYARKAGGPNEQWMRAGETPAPLLDDNNRLLSLLLQLSRLNAEEFVHDVSAELGKFGLDRPAITAIVYSSSGPEASDAKNSPLLTLTLGDPVDSSGKRFARLNGDGPVFTVSARIADALGIEYR